MERKSYHGAALALRGLIVAVFALVAAHYADGAVPTAWARVDFFSETHFRCYIVSQQTPAPAQTVTLDDQFQPPTTLTIDEPLQFCAPTSKNGAEIEAPEEHLTMYAAPSELDPDLVVSTEDQFGRRTLRAIAARVLLVPTQKVSVAGVPTGLDFPRRLNHDWCYHVEGPAVDRDVRLSDQFRTDSVRVEHPRLFCNPVEKTVAGRRPTRIVESDVHLTCYEIKGPQRTEATRVGVFNQFERDTFTITSFELLCVPSAKLGFRAAS